jgi:hypothetical protein
MRGLRSRTSVNDEDDVADLKVVKILDQRLCCHMSGTSAYSHTYGDHDDLRNPRSSQDCGSRWRWTESGNSAARRRAAVVRSLSYAALRGVTRERGGGGGGQRPRRWRWTAAKEVEGGGQVEEESFQARGIVCAPPSLGPPLYRGEECTLAPPSRHQGGGQGEG